VFAGMDLPAWQKLGYDQHSVIADPLFMDAENNDYRLQPDSPAHEIGFKPFDFSKAGVYGDVTWIERAAQAEMPALEIAPGPPPMAIHDDFETSLPGSRPRIAQTQVEGRGDVIEVTAEKAASGKQSLKVGDTAGLKFAHDPHFYYSPLHKSGTTVCKLDLLLEPRVSINYQWRDWRRSPYRVGPSMNIVKNRLIVSGKTLLELPEGKWVRFEIAADLGQGNSGKWNLTVTPADQPPQEFKNIENGSRAFEQLTWLGFASNAISESVFYVDNLSIENH
jgi:hypothetical protein